jgi:YVTN family beta-propeller protein
VTRLLLAAVLLVAPSCAPVELSHGRDSAPGRGFPPGAILLPDSLGGITEPRDIVLDEATDRLFVAGAGGIAVIDAETGRRTGVISMPDVFELWLNPASGRLYARGAIKYGGAVSVIDCAAGNVLKTDAVGRAWPDCLNPVDNKVYARYHSGWGERLAVFDATTGRRLQTMNIGTSWEWRGDPMLWSSAARGVYCAGRDGIDVVDGQTNRVRTRLEADTPLCENPSTGKLYAADGICVAVVDCRTDSVVKWLGTTCDLSVGICDPATGKVYVGGTSRGRTPQTAVTIIDGAADTILDSIPVTGDVSQLLLDAAGGRVFCVGANRVTVIDCRTDSVAGVIRLDSPVSRAVYYPPARRIYGIAPVANTVVVVDCARMALASPVALGQRVRTMLFDPDRDRLYCADAEGISLLAINAASGAVAGELSTGFAPVALALTPRGVVYCAVSGSNMVRALEPATGRVLADVPVHSEPVALCYSPRSNRLFCLNRTGYDKDDSAVLTVIDCRNNTILKELKAAGPAGLFAYDSVRDRVYTAAPVRSPKRDSDVCVEGIDAATAARVFQASFPGYPRALCYDTANDRLYCAHTYPFALTAIDCATGTVTKRIKAGNSPTVLALNPLRGKLYCAGPDLAIGGGVGDTDVSEMGTGITSGRGRGVAVIDARTNALVSYIRTPRGPSALRWVPETDRIYCSCSSADSVVVIDCATDRVIASLAAGDEPGAIELSPASRTVFVASRGSGIIRILDGATPGYPR